jgi:hypothetical protein
MMDRNKMRLSYVRDLLELRKPSDEIAKLLSKFDWDFEGQPVVLEKRHLKMAVLRYLKNEIDGREIENWANLIEGREDIEADKSCEELINSLVFELANPLLTSSFDQTRAKQILKILE